MGAVLHRIVDARLSWLSGSELETCDPSQGALWRLLFAGTTSTQKGKAAKVNRWSPFFLRSTILFADDLPSSPIYSQSYLSGSSQGPETSDHKGCARFAG